MTGQRIRASRKACDCNQRRLANLAKISVGFLSDIENGKRNPSARTLFNIGIALGVSLDYLMKGNRRKGDRRKGEARGEVEWGDDWEKRSGKNLRALEVCVEQRDQARVALNRLYLVHDEASAVLANMRERAEEAEMYLKVAVDERNEAQADAGRLRQRNKAHESEIADYEKTVRRLRHEANSAKQTTKS